MKRIAAPVIGGLLSSLILVLVLYPVIYMIWRGREFRDTPAGGD
jgi:Cu(I)/Ag(I) efflux system membrane protein CusA/SilA